MRHVSKSQDIHRHQVARARQPSLAILSVKGITRQYDSQTVLIHPFALSPLTARCLLAVISLISIAPLHPPICFPFRRSRSTRRKRRPWETPMIIGRQTGPLRLCVLPTCSPSLSREAAAPPWLPVPPSSLPTPSSSWLACFRMQIPYNPTRRCARPLFLDFPAASLHMAGFKLSSTACRSCKGVTAYDYSGQEVVILLCLRSRILARPGGG